MPTSLPAAILVASAEHASPQFAPTLLKANCQVAPELVEVQTLATSNATNLVPSADEATECQFPGGAPVAVHVVPESLEA